jgi:prolycopene isomerase
MTEQVVIIGAGMAGLTTAAYLIRAGVKVQVFEQHTLPGGYISSFVREGFTFPAGPTSFGSNGIIFPILKELGLENKRQFLRAAHQVSWAEHDIPFHTPQQVQHDLAECFPQDRRGLERYFRWVNVGGKGFKELLESGIMFGRGVLQTMLPLLLRHPLFPWASLVARGQTNRSLHERYFKDASLQQMLNQLGYPVMPGQNTLGMWITYFYDTWVPAGGMQAFANTFVRFIHAHGGEVHLGREVKRIRVKNGQAVGVTLENGDEIPAQWVVSAADLHHTCFNLLGREQLPAGMVAKLERARSSESAFAVYLGLRGSPELSTALERFKESRVCFTCADGQYIQLALLSKDDPSLAPPGKHALFAGMLVPYETWEPLKSNETAYHARKAAFAEEIITRAAEFIPNLRAHIEVQEAASPLTFERYTSNWRAGTAGWNWDPQYAPHFDFAKDLHIKNFYAVGHYVFNPGGVPTAMITAWYIAREIIKMKGFDR